jgi:hypothetical protein
MIEFPCNCGYRFSMPDDLAGSLIQCPKCKKLNDVPLLGDMQNLDESGIYKLDDAPKTAQEPQRVAKLTQVYTREHFDDQGIPIDLRGASSDPSLIGTPEPTASAAPKYDPITGELLQEIDIKPHAGPPASAVPLARPAALPPKTIVDGMDVPAPQEIWTLPVRLLNPGNLLVIFFIFFAQVVGQVMMIGIAMMYLLLAPFWLILHFLLISHFVNVVDETGPTSRHELPTPLRHLDWHDDTLGPAIRAIVALAICYAPALLMVMDYKTKKDAPVVFGVGGTLALIGTVLFPAALLTVATSGTLVNARPDRLVGVAIRCGGEYVLAVITWIVGISVWLAGTLAVNWQAAAAAPKLTPADTGISPPPHVTWYSAYAILILGIYLMHLFCWQLGILYRQHHEDFPWVLQRHVGGKRTIKPEDTAFPVQRAKRVHKTEPQAVKPMRVEPIPPHRNQP